MKCYEKYKQFVQVSGICGPQVLSYLPKRFHAPLKSFVWKQHIGGPF